MSRSKKSLILLLLSGLVYSLTFFTACDKEENENPDPNDQQEPEPLVLTIDTAVTYQTIAGFGGANRMWGTQFLKPAEARKAFGMDDTDLGMSLFRMRIASDSTEWPLILEAAQEAQSYGVKILASPWSPPAWMKSNESDVGGYLSQENYGAFADYLNSFIDYMASNGVEIYAVSIQNEPDVDVSYESCDWTPGRMTSFLRDYGHLIEGALVAAPESYNFNPYFTNALLDDPDAAENLDIVAGHIYGGGLGTFPSAEEQGKEIWMTEYLMNLNTGNSGAAAWNSYTEAEIWEESMAMLQTVHESMENNWNAYIWWYLQRYYSFIGDGTEGTVNGEVLKRGYAFSHYSKFVRPGYVRIGQNSSKSNNLEITAYKGEGKIVLVIINPQASTVNNFNIDIPEVTAVSAWETTVDANREEIEIEITDSTLVTKISPLSITTILAEE